MGVSRIICMFLFAILIIQGAHATLTSEDVKEGECLKDLKTPSSVDVGWLFHPRNYYVPLASQHLYRNYFDVLTGRCAEDQAELNQLNLRITFTGGAVTTTGNGQRFYQMCTPWSIHLSLAVAMDVKCAPSFGTEKTNLTKIGTTRDNLVWSDNKTAFMIVRCVHEKEKDWKVLSTKPTLDDTTKEAILAKVRELGFNQANVAYLPYENDGDSQTEKKEVKNPLKDLAKNLGFSY